MQGQSGDSRARAASPGGRGEGGQKMARIRVCTGREKTFFAGQMEKISVFSVRDEAIAEIPGAAEENKI